jgi:hypothetical protein
MLLEEANPVLDMMIKNQWLFPATECVHIFSFALSIGTIAVVDLSLLDFGLGRKSAVPVWRNCRPWTLTGLVLIVFSGLLLFATDPDHYYLNPNFQFKIPVFILAVIWNYTIHRKAVLSSDAPRADGRFAAAVSLVLWIGVVFGGLFVAFGD